GSHLASGLELATNDVESPDAAQDGQNLGGFAHLRTQLPGSRVGARDLGCRVALDRRQPRSPRDLQGQLPLGTLPRLRQGFERAKPARRVLDGLTVPVLLDG